MKPAQGFHQLAQKLKETKIASTRCGARLAFDFLSEGSDSSPRKPQDAAQELSRKVHVQHENTLCSTHVSPKAEDLHLCSSHIKTQSKRCDSLSAFSHLTTTQKQPSSGMITCTPTCQALHKMLIQYSPKRHIHTHGQAQYAYDSKPTTINSTEEEKSEHDQKDTPTLTEEEHLEPALEVLTEATSGSALKTVGVVPGKGPPPEPPVDCCMSGCVNCVWIAYAEELREYYSDGGEAARKAIEQIENPSLKAFLKLELGL